MILSNTLKTAIEQKLKCQILKTTPLYGGDINTSYKLSTDKGECFVKYNNNKLYPGMFEKEARGLELIASTKSIHTPKVITTGNTAEEAYLILSYIDTQSQRGNFWEQFGKELALMHKSTAARFGLNEDNYIGTLPQSNLQHDNFIDFFINERLEAQLDMAEQSKLINSQHRRSFEKLYAKLPNLLPKEAPALLHGDLWSGNYMVNNTGEPCLIDPAVYCGHREIDVAMTTLFGRFDPAFYESYHATFPLEAGWKERLAIYNFYPLLVHVNLFGGSYLGQVESILRKYN